ncbi:hypothetical protein HPP92_020892 [Vanilla planifolia]|uniref:Uncharacterized protein n=1 Tax=Vanilla planifolia TaxID=51239 RepID=A0A835UK71_VANPL|nr:hypothetical protein HPP92_020892 [Vanilla planifolia]
MTIILDKFIRKKMIEGEIMQSVYFKQSLKCILLSFFETAMYFLANVIVHCDLSVTFERNLVIFSKFSNEDFPKCLHFFASFDFHVSCCPQPSFWVFDMWVVPILLFSLTLHWVFFCFK